MLSHSLLAACIAGIALAAPTVTVEKRADKCGQYDSISTGTYTVYNDLWGESGATSGSGCFGVDSLSGSTVKWHSTWTWVGGSGVKSYPNVVVKESTVKQLSAIKTIPSTWSWSYTGTNIVADVAYDMFTSSTATGSNQYEIMVWLAAIGGTGPISSGYGSDGKPTIIATTTIGGHSFNLYKGPNGSTTVYSFVPASGQIASFSGDIKLFLAYLVQHEGLPNTQYLTSLGAGTEPTSGSNAKFTVSGYSVVIN
ncbi:hypothetical protein LTR78_009091 [Recurvomyces mirabilis]|uniref:Glycoside hydrolase family 12 protein n=1 Tax=Recurvomyces mirabilis TaxID=574656 RepID=A0AAE0WIK3_9PEZI|nr:hypothetical protein LTR78_009091 [Recurvomyces mirabilis]KAK5161029.1 hypothetical protein LTS14_000823 [Recurvomyces mirabilis]